MFRVLLASGLFALLGLAAPVQAQVYQPGYPMAYYHPVPNAYGYSVRAARHHGYAYRHARPRQAYWQDNCRCASPRPHAYRHAMRHRHHAQVHTRYVNAPVHAAPMRRVYRDSHVYRAAPVYREERIYRRPAPVYRQGVHGGVYGHDGYRQRPAVRSYVEADRPYGYAYRQRPNYRNAYSNSYREDAGSWRTRRDGVVVIHPRQPMTRPVQRTHESYMRPGQQGSVVVTRPRGQYQQPHGDMRQQPPRHQPRYRPE